MTSEWSRQKKIKLIELYRQTPILWAKRGTKVHPRQRSNALQKIAEEIGVNVLEVEKKLHVLRSQFMRERKKILNSQLTNEEPYQSHWQYYNKLQFLSELIDPPILLAQSGNGKINIIYSEGENSNLSAYCRGEAEVNGGTGATSLYIPCSKGWENKLHAPSGRLSEDVSSVIIREDQCFENLEDSSFANNVQDEMDETQEVLSNISDLPTGGVDDTLVSFGNYLVSLLRRLPLDKSYQLQQQFIRDTMNTTLEFEKERRLVSQAKRKNRVNKASKQLHQPLVEARHEQSRVEGPRKHKAFILCDSYSGPKDGQTLQPNRIYSAGEAQSMERHIGATSVNSIEFVGFKEDLGLPFSCSILYRIRNWCIWRNHTNKNERPQSSLIKKEIDASFETVFCNGQPSFDSAGADYFSSHSKENKNV